MLTAPGSTSYAYDGLGNRIQQTVSSIVTDYLLDVQPGLVKVLAQTENGDTTRYIHSPRGIHAQENDMGAWSWILQDGLGSVRSFIDASLGVDAVQSYDPIGNPDGSYGAGFGFTGEQTDGNGQVYLRARYYNPSIGVFNSLDPVEGVLQRPMSLNRYSWVEGNTPNAIDPSGKSLAIANQMNSGSCTNSNGQDCGYPFNENQLWSYILCRTANRQDPCPQTSNWRWNSISGANVGVCENTYTSFRYTPEHAWRYELGILDRHETLLLKAYELRHWAIRGEISELELLASTADYACQLGYSTLENVRALSYIFAGTDQWPALSIVEGIIDAMVMELTPFNTVPIRAGLPDLEEPFGGVQNSGLHPHYDDNKHQLFHFVPYMASVAEGGLFGELLSLAGNYIHEDWGIPDWSGGASWQDENLAYAGMAIGAEIWRGNIGSCDLGDVMRTVLTQPVPPEIGNRSTIPDEYPWIAICRLAPNDAWCRPSVPFPENYP